MSVVPLFSDSAVFSPKEVSFTEAQLGKLKEIAVMFCSSSYFEVTNDTDFALLQARDPILPLISNVVFTVLKKRQWASEPFIYTFAPKAGAEGKFSTVNFSDIEPRVMKFLDSLTKSSVVRAPSLSLVRS